MYLVGSGELVPDVRVREWSMPRNAKSDTRKLGRGTPAFDIWASTD
jgi:hypothetical protein